MNRVFNLIITVNSYESELKIEDCKLKICGCRSPRRRRYNLSEPEASLRPFHNGKKSLILQSSIDNLQFLRDRQISLIAYLAHKTHRNRN